MPRLSVDGRHGGFANANRGARNSENVLNVRGDAMPVGGHPAESRPMEPMHEPVERPMPVARPLEPTSEQPALREPDRSGVPAGRSSRRPLEGPSRSATPVSERESTGNTDRARYDDGLHRYDWNVREDERGDYRGRVGAGTSRGANDLDVDVGFDEATGDVDARLRAGHHFSGSTEAHGEVGVDGDGLTHGRLGASHTLEGGHVVRGEVGMNADGRAHADAGWSHARGENREDVRARADDNGVSAEYRGHHEGEGWRSDERLSVNSDGTVRGSASGEVRREVRPGTTVDARGHVSTEGEFRGDIGVAHRVSESVTVTERIGLDEDGVRTHTHGARAGLPGGRGHVSAELEHDSEGNRSLGGEGSLRAGGNTHGVSARVSGEDGELGRVEGRYTFHSGTDRDHARTRVETDVRLEGEGRWRVGGTARRRLTDEVTVREGVTLDSSGRRSHEHGVDFNHRRFGNASATVRHDAEGNVDAEGRYSVERDGTRGEVRVGYGEDGSRIEGELTHETARGRASANGGWRSGEGFHGEASVTRRVGEDSEVSARIAGNESGNLSGSVRGETRLGEDGRTRASASVGGNTRDGSIRGDVRLDRSASAGSPGGHLTAGMSRNDTSVEGNLGGGMNVTNLFGIGASGRVGGDARVTLSRRRPARASAEWVDSLRDDVLRDEPEGRYVSFGARGRATINVGARVPLGAGYVNAGYERGENYDVEVTRLTGDARLGERPSMSELNVDNSANGVLEMRTGESFRITGSTTHTARGGGGVGTGVSVGPIGEVTASAGVDVSYAVSGRTSLDVTRGGEGTARVVVSHEDSNEIRGGLNIRAGVSPNYSALAGVAGVGELPDIGPAGDLATTVARGTVDRWLNVAVTPEHSVRDGDRRLLDVRLDLSDDSAGVAYDEAVGGDWTRIEELARDGHRAVEVERSIFTELNTTATPLTVTGLGLGYHSDSREELRESEVNVGSGRFEVTSEIENDARKVDGWFSGSHVSVTDHAREVRSLDGAELGDVKASEHWLSWKFGSSDVNTSREELIAQLVMVERMVGAERAGDLVAYKERVGAVEEHRRFWIGPRNELRETDVAVSVDIARSGLAKLNNLDADDLWSRYDTAWRANNPDETEAPWDLSEDIFMDPTTAMYAEMVAEGEEASRKAVLGKLADASKLGDEARIDTVRELLAAARADTALMSVIVELAGSENTKVSLSVDSTAGANGKPFDFQFVSTGSTFDVQKRVFGEDL